jgi:hypothetical protein
MEAGFSGGFDDGFIDEIGRATRKTSRFVSGSDSPVVCAGIDFLCLGCIVDCWGGAAGSKYYKDQIVMCT